MSLSEHGKSKLEFIAANLAMVKALPSGIGNLPEEFPRYRELSHQMTALSSGFMDLYKVSDYLSPPAPSFFFFFWLYVGFFFMSDMSEMLDNRSKLYGSVHIAQSI